MFHPWSHYNSAYQPGRRANLQMTHGIMAPGRDSDFGFAWSRTQFLIKPAFACTIDKAQGATVNRLGLLLDDQKRAPGRTSKFDLNRSMPQFVVFLRAIRVNSYHPHELNSRDKAQESIYT